MTSKKIRTLKDIIKEKQQAKAKEMTFLDTKELAERWKMSPRTLYNQRSLGNGPPYIKVGTRVLYPIDEIEKYELEDNKT